MCMILSIIVDLASFFKDIASQAKNFNRKKFVMIEIFNSVVF